jgi:hypothetical protein
MVVRASSYATWTTPAHHALLSGLLPWTGTPSSGHDLYGDQIRAMASLLGIPPQDRGDFARYLWLPSWLGSLGYYTAASVSMPVIHENTPINRGWRQYRSALRFNDATDHLEWFRGQPWRENQTRGPRSWFCLMNLGETHYPYTSAGDPRSTLPHLSGLHGAARRMVADPASEHVEERARIATLSDPQVLAALHEQQVVQALRLQPLLAEMIDLCPSGTRVTITADHGEAFGEGGYFGHGPVTDPIVLSVPLIDGLVP